MPKDPAKKNPDSENPDDWRTEWIDPREEALMTWAEKLGTIVPDIVLHAGHPLLVQAVFDFKFPCKEMPGNPWRPYPPGSPHEGRRQNEIYKAFLKKNPELMQPKRNP